MGAPEKEADLQRATHSSGWLIGLLGLLLGVAAIGSMFLPTRLGFLVLGLLILIFGLLQNMAGFARRDSTAAGSWFSRGGASIITGILLIALPRMTFAGLAILLGLSWVISGCSTCAASLGRKAPADWIYSFIDGLVSIVLGVAVAIQWPISGIVSVGLFVGLRCLSAGWAILVGGRKPWSLASTENDDVHPDSSLALPSHPYIKQLRAELENEVLIRSRSDRAWCWLFLLTFFAIHVARMDTDYTFIGLLSPAGAVVGDVFFAIVIAYGVVAPIMVTWRSLTRPIERRAWTRSLAQRDQNQEPGLRSRLSNWWLTRRMLGTLRRSQARGSATAAIGWGLRTGLPAAAIIMALTPLWGVSWFFNTETWVAGPWEIWAEQRTDTWREHMVQAVKRDYGAAAGNPDFFRVEPDGLRGVEDFSFIVIGDTGEGDASQHILRDQLLAVGQKPAVKFLIVSSDVIYPAGAMKDYEPKFYLPFKGFHKPIYAVPGNHDWYDALESFTANFLEAKAARSAMRARREVDLKLTTTTETRIDDMIQEASRLRQEYQIQAAKQRAPYFEISANGFSLIVVDTGILRRIDEDQMRWLDAALERGRGKFKMVILGHPLYAAGHYQGQANPDFAKIHELLKQHEVDIVMAGDTHDFEYYKEPYKTGTSERSMYHFVNGGGGAYLSIGTALSWPKSPPVKECGFYPRASALKSHLETFTPLWRWPLWLWVKHLGAWPSSPEGVASAFNYDRAPFFQSFMEVRVEGSKNRVSLWLHGVNGNLTWRDVYSQDGLTPGGKADNELVEFRFPLRRERR